MKYRTRLLVAFLLAALLPMLALSLIVRQQMTARLTAQSQARVDALVNVIESNLAHEGDRVHVALAQLRDAIASDNRFRRAAVDGVESERRYLLDYAGDAMRLAGLSMFQIQDEGGRIVSSGQFRNDYDRVEPELPRFLHALPDRTALVRARTPGQPILVLASIDSVVVGRAQFSLVGGVEANTLNDLTRTTALKVSLFLPGGSSGVIDSTRTLVREIPIPFFDSETHAFRMGAFRVTDDLTPVQSLRRSVDRWFAIAFALTALSIVLLSIWLAATMSRPVADLAAKTSALDLDSLDAQFDTTRGDEIGTLSRGLAAMTGRLRESRAQLKEAERRATTGDLARQINHDIKNGLTPIRNAFRHLTQHANEPHELQNALQERSRALDESIAYLESLAGNYARLSQRGARERCDVSDIVRRVASSARARARVETLLANDAVVMADPLAIRRIVENLVDNAIQSLEGSGGNVTLETRTTQDAPPRVLVIVSDRGAGMTDEQRTHIFDDFYTTRPEGSGLGLSIVRRLVMDMDGTIAVESEAGKGSRFTVDLPAAPGVGA